MTCQVRIFKLQTAIFWQLQSAVFMLKKILSFVLLSHLAPATLAQTCITYPEPQAPGIHALTQIFAKRAGIYGIDVSHYQGMIDWKQAKLAGVSFAYVKASEGVKFIDPCFARNWLNSKEAGVVRGAYHFFRANLDPIAQAKNFVATVKPLRNSFDLPPALDIEYGPDMNSVDAIELMARIKQWLEYVEHRLGVTPVIYTSQTFWEDYIGHNPVFAKYPLWLAAALQHPGPPSSWQDWTFWQFSPRGKVPGIMTAVDLSYFGGDKRDFLKLLIHTDDSQGQPYG